MLLLLLASVSTVVASDVNDDMSSTDDGNLTIQSDQTDTVIEQSNDEMTNNEQSTESEVLSASSDEGRDTQSDVLSASSDEDVLTGNSNDLYYKIYYEYTNVKLEEDYLLSSPVNIHNKNGLVIDGDGHTIDANRACTIFSIKDTCTNITFKNIKFINSGATAIVFDIQKDGAYYSYCSFSFINCTFENNTGTNGGTISAKIFKGEINVINSTFKGNKASQGAFYYASYNSGAVVTLNLNVENSSFTGNSGTGNGGSIYVFYGTEVTIRNSNFTRNTGGTEGGVMRVNTPLNIEGCRFYSNSADNGGAIFMGRAIDCNVKDTYFENNHATGRGGALFTWGATIDSCEFVNNHVSTTGSGDIGRGGAYYSRNLGNNFRDCTFTGNYGREGGAIYTDPRCTSFTAYMCTFNDNSATDMGGAIFSCIEGVAAVDNSNFNNNSAKYGGAIATEYRMNANTNKISTVGSLLVQRSSFSNNSASIEGGAIYIKTSSIIEINNIFTNNNASLGGAIYMNYDGGKIDGCTFESNDAVSGASVYWKLNNGEIANSHFKENNPAGSSVYWTGTGGKISSSTFEGTNMIYIANVASVVLTSNTQTSSTYDGTSVYLEGQASFSLNEFKNAIYNKGVINSQTYMTTLKNITVVTNVNSLPVFSRIEDDNGNSIRVDDNITIFYDNGNQLTTTFNNTDYVSFVSNLAIGLHNFTSSGYKASNFNNIQLKNGGILYLVMNLTVNQTNYGEKVVFTTTIVNTTLNGTIGLDINDVHYDVVLKNGTAVLTLYNMAPNEYKVTATYMEYNQTLYTNVTIDVQLRNSTMNITANNITYGEVVSINITTTNGTVGDVFIFVNNKMYIVTLKNSTGQLNLTNLAGGTYTVYAVYNGDVHFNGCTNNTAFTVAKHNLTINITATDISMGQTAVIQVKMPNDANGTTYVYVDSAVYQFTKQPITINVANLTAGTHTVRVIYDGNDKYMPGSNSTTFKVKKIVINPVIVANDIYVGDNATITVNLQGATNATGLVLLTVNNNNYYGYANKTHITFIIPNLPYGKYNVTAIYLEDDVYDFAKTNSSFKVDYVTIDPAITYEQDDDLNLLLNVTVPADVNGDITIEVNGTNYTANVVKGKFSVEIKGLTGGQYPAILYFANDTKYQAVNKPFNIILDKINVQIHINAPNSYVGQNATITVTVPTDAEGNITITSNNKSFTQKVVNGAAVFSVPNLPHNTYDIVAQYSGDRKYNPSDVTGRLYVDKVDPNPYSYINVTNIHVGEIATFNITMPKDITGKVNLTMQNKTYTVNVTNGFGQINIPGLKAGSPVLVTAYYAGNDKYYGCERNYTAFAVLKITNYPINITAVTNSTVGNNMTANITVDIADDANGEGYIIINNKTYNVTYTNGIANIVVSGLTAGMNYTIDAYFAGDDKYTEGRASKTIGSNKTLDYIFEVSADDIFVGQTAVIVIYLPNATIDDKVTLYIPGKGEETYVLTNQTWKNGTIQLTAPDLAAGSYNCHVTYGGNNQYESSTRYGTLVVSRINVSPRISYNATYVGENLTVEVTLPTDSNGKVSMNINNKTYNATVVNGTAILTIPNLEAKTYPAILSYSGNEKYNPRNQNYDIRILKVYDYQFELSTVDIYVGDNETITIHLPTDMDGIVSLTIPGTSYINHTVILNKGNATLKIPNLKAGNYNVTVSVTNSSKYLDQYEIGYFTVSTIGEYTFILNNVTTVYVRENITIVVHLPDDATGNVTVNIFGENHRGTVNNGTAVIKVKATKDGTFAFTASFEEEGKYNYKSLNGHAVVIKKEVVINPTYEANVNVDENITFYFTFDSDATGNVSVTTRGITYSAELVNGSANVTIPGYPLSSIYSPAVSYTGDDKYYSASEIVKITTHKVSDYNITVEVANITVDDVEMVNITIPSDATEDVLISGNFSDHTMSVKIKNGIATFNITDLPAGTYYINVRYQGYQKYADKNVTKTFTVSKVVPPISIEFVNNDTLIVKLPTLANGHANITVGDVIDTQIPIFNGVGSLNISGLRPGKYAVNATFLGGVRYLENSTSINITIPKIKDYILPVTALNITVGENSTITVTLPDYATGTVNITIDNGNVIEVQIKSGKAVHDAVNMAVGVHNVTVAYANDEYVLKTNSTKFEVKKIITAITAIIDGNASELTVNATLTEGVTGNVTITVDGKPYPITGITSNKINLTVPIIPGEHFISIDYSGDENHTVATYSNQYYISKISDYTINVTATPVITVLENNILNITLPKGIEGRVYVYINDELYDEPAIINSTTGKATLTLDKLLAGVYSVTVTFESNRYEYKYNDTVFTVIKINTTMDVQVNNITRDLAEIINVTLNETATGRVLINVSGQQYSYMLNNGNASVTLPNLDADNYTVVVTYFGDDTFNNNSFKTSFTVSRIPVNITITAKDIIIGQEANFTIETSRPITDQVTVRIDNKNYTAVIFNGKGNLMVLGQNIGLHNVTVIYEGDEDYLPANDTINVTVHGKTPTSIKVNVTNITVEDTVFIYVNVTGAENGTATIYMLGNPITTDVVMGRAVFNYTNLTARDYHFTVEYNENEFYLNSTATGDFTVFKKQSFITVNVTNIKVGEVEEFNITISNGTTGHVLISFADVHLYADINGKTFISVPVADLPVGNYNVTVTYAGDENFNGSSDKSAFNITKLSTSINITCNETIIMGHPVEFTITTSANVTKVVILNVDGKNHTTYIVNGKGTYTVYNLITGNYTATVYFEEDDKYKSVDNYTKFNVTGKTPVQISVKVDNITLGGTAIFIVNITNGTTGNVTLNIAGRPQSKEIVNGSVTFTRDDLTARDYHVTVTYVGDDNYLPGTNTTEFTVFRKDSTIDMNVSNIKVGQHEIINVTVTKGATGIVLIDIAGIKVYAEINNETGIATATFDDLGVNNYNVTATYLGDDNYNGSSTKKSFNVTKLTTLINITCNDVYVINQPVEFTITTSENITEVVTIEVDGKNYTSFVENGKGTYTVYNLGAGNYTATVYFINHVKYEDAWNSAKFNVTGKTPVSLIVQVENITLGENATIYVDVIGAADGRVTLNLAGIPETKDVVGGKVNFTRSGLSARDYVFTVTYIENDEHYSNATSAEFTVFRKASTVDMNVSNIKVGQHEIINVTVTKGATGIVLIDIAGVKVYAEINNETGIATATFDDLGVNTYNVTATYLGDDNYNGSSTKKSFNVTKLTTTIVIVTNKTVVIGHPVVFNITTSANVTKVITINVNNKNYTTFIENGKGTYIVYDELPADDYKATVYFAEDDKYYSEQNYTNFTVTGKMASAITINVSDVTVGKNVTVYVNVTHGTTGKVSLSIYGQVIEKELTNSMANFTIPNLPARDFPISVYYHGDDNYLISNETGHVTVNKKNATISLNVTNSYVGELDIINVTVPEGASGHVLISVGGMQIYALINGSNILHVPVSELKLGEYNVTAQYVGDENYTSAYANASFNVTKRKMSIVINTTDIFVEQVAIFNITASANVTEVITIEVDGDNYTAYIIEGKGTFTLPKYLNVGKYNATVYFAGNTQYDIVQNTTEFEVFNQTVSNIIVKVDNITVGENATIYVEVTDGAAGRVSIVVAGNTYYADLTDSKANFTIPNLIARDYHVTAHYFGNVHYFESENATDFTVKRKESDINVTAGNITVSELQTININITNGTSGVVLIDINGTDYFANITNGVAKLDVKNLAVGEYKVTVTYNGDANYKSSYANTTFKVSKINSEIALELVTPNPVAFGGDVLINVTGPKDFTGVAIVTVHGLNDENHTVFINNGEGSLILVEPEVGHYTVSAVYQENDKYLSNVSNTVEFEVYASGSELHIQTQNIYVGDNETIIVTVAGNYSENVNITIGNITRLAPLVYNATSNESIATFKFTDRFDAGIQNVHAFFVSTEGGKIITHEGNSYFIVSKINSTVGINPILSINVGENVTIKLTLDPSDAIGDIDVYVGGEKHTLTRDNLTLILSNLSAGHYTVQAMYSGDSKYLASSAEAEFNVTKNNVTIKVDVADIEKGQVEYINVTVAPDAKGYVLIDINGTKYYAEIKEGVARFNITDLSPGNYDVNATFIGDDKYFENTTSDSFTVSKLTTTIKINGSDIYFGQDEVFNITTSANLTVVVVISVNGTNYTTFIENGIGQYIVSLLPVGKHNATVYFAETTDYESAKDIYEFEVFENKVSAIDVRVESVVVGNNVTIEVNVTDGAKGSVMIVVAGTVYAEDLNNGRATFTIENLTARHYQVSAIYFGDEVYAGSDNTAEFDVIKKNTTIHASVTNSTVGSVEYINVTVDTNASGTVLISIGESHYYAVIDRGVARFNITGLLADVYTADITYLGDDNFNNNTGKVEIKISQLSTLINITSFNITVGQTEEFTIRTSENITAVVYVEIEGVNYTTFISEGVGTFSTSNFTVAKEYKVNVYYNGDEKYMPISNVTTFTVSAKKPTSITVVAQNITVGGVEFIRVILNETVSGNVTIIVAGNAYTNVTVGNEAVFYIGDLTARDYHVTAYFFGNEYFLPSNNTAEFTVGKKNTTIVVSVTNSTVGSVEYINVTVDENAKGNILISIGQSHYYAEIDHGVARFNITGLLADVYTANVTYVGDDHFNENFTQVEIKISQLSTLINITSFNITVGQTEEFTIRTSENITAVVYVEIEGVNYTTFISEGVGTFSTSNFTVAKEYTVNVYYNGDEKYSPISNKTTFTVSAKKETSLVVVPTNITIGANETIEVTVTEGVEGNITIIIAGDAYTSPIEGGVAKFTIENLTARDYHVTAYFFGNEYFLPSNNTAEFTVGKKNTTIVVSVTNSTVGGVEYINVTVDENAKGNILISIGQSHYYAEIDHGVARFNITGLLVGDYTANVTYVGDDHFNENFTQAKITISQKTTLINITGQNITYGQTEKLVIRTSENITALVTVEVGTRNYTTFISEGYGELVLDNLTAGPYTATVYYAGSDIYVGINNFTTFEVDAKKASEVIIQVENITIGADEHIVINVTKGATGNVTIVLAGKEYTRPIDSATGQVLFTKEDLSARDYDVTVIYNGDTYYYGNSSVAHFTVSKKPSVVDLNVSTITVGDTEVINVTVTPGAQGVVLINVSGTYYYRDLEGGKATFNVAGLKTGEYNATVTYTGDDTYDRSVASKTFVVNPKITVEAGTNDGNKTTLTIKVSDNATGNATVIINGTEYNATVKDGVATVDAKGVDPGEQNVTVIFNDGKNTVVSNQTVDIPKVTGYETSVNASDIKVGEDGTIIVTVPEDATGNVTITVGNQTITKPVENGTATFTVSDLPVGSHNIDVSYEGDDKYASTTTKSTINVGINVPTINAVDKLVRGWNSIYDYEAVFLDKFGNALEGIDITFTINGKTYTVRTEEHGIAKLTTSHLAVGDYDVISYNSVTKEKITKKLSIVPRLIKNKDITMDFVDGTSYSVVVIGDDGNPVGEGEIIDIYVNTIHYVSKTDKNGVARLKINLNPKTYKVTAEYKNYQVKNKLVIKQTFKLVKKTVKVKKGKKLVLKAKLKWTNGKAIKGKVIKFKFRGKTYKAKTNAKGIAKVTIKAKITKKLKKGGKYAYSAKYRTNILKGKVRVK